MEKFTIDGIVIRTSVTGEADRIAWVLTRDRGIIRAFAKGARGTKSRLHGGTSLFAYCNFSFTEKNNAYNISEAQVKEVFFDLRKSMETLTLAQYFCEVIAKAIPEKCYEEVYLRLLLNSLHLLCKSDKHELLIKSVFELRLVSVAGYMPSVVACENCGEYLTDIMYFNCQTGELFCSSCGKQHLLPAVPSSVVSAMRHICFSDFSKIFSFELPEDMLLLLNRLTENYLRSALGQEFKLLSYLSEINKY
ncbi:MAG: DNA repair protein RecO [Clostridia bacterium]|nr:DNA repair protein RecO [Clostridia bacterium]